MMFGATHGGSGGLGIPVMVPLRTGKTEVAPRGTGPMNGKIRSKVQVIVTLADEPTSVTPPLNTGVGTANDRQLIPPVSLVTVFWYSLPDAKGPVGFVAA
jgi:hypothetical protein